MGHQREISARLKSTTHWRGGWGLGSWRRVRNSLRTALEGLPGGAGEKGDSPLFQFFLFPGVYFRVSRTELHGIT